MARAIKWNVEFISTSDKPYVINIYEEDYTGEIISLTPAENPMSLNQSGASNILEPVRKITGYLRVLDEGNLTGLNPLTNLDHYVELISEDTLIWRGYMAAASYTQPWEPEPIEVEFPLMSPLAVLESINMSDYNIGQINMAALLIEILSATGCSYNNIFYPSDGALILKTANNDYINGSFLVELSRYNYIKINDSDNSDESDAYIGDSYYNILAEIAKFYGWSITEEGSNIIILSESTNELIQNDWAQLEYLAGISEIEGLEEVIARNSSDIESLDYDGVDHRETILPGCGKIEIKCNVNYSAMKLPSIDFDSKKVYQTWDYNWNNSLNSYKQRIKFLDPRSDKNIKLSQWTLEDSQLIKSDWNTSDDILHRILRCYLVREDQWATDEEGKINYNYNDYIRITASDAFPERYDPAHLDDYCVMAISSKTTNRYTSGALCLSASVNNSYARYYYGWYAESEIQSQIDASNVWLREKEGLSIIGSAYGKLRLHVKVGNKWFNGTTWQDTKCTFLINIGADQENSYNVYQNLVDEAAAKKSGKIINTKVLSMPYNGAVGYVIPINETLTGIVEVGFYPWQHEWRFLYRSAWDSPSYEDIYSWMPYYAALFISNFKIDYFLDDEVQSDKTENRYYTGTGKSYIDKKELTLSLCSDNQNPPGFGILSYNGSNLTDKNVYYYDSVEETYKLKRPELKLLERLKNIYSVRSKTLTIEIDLESFSTVKTIYELGSEKYIVTGYNIDYINSHVVLNLYSLLTT